MGAHILLPRALPRVCALKDLRLKLSIPILEKSAQSSTNRVAAEIGIVC